jgi:hypothetical protein
MLLSTALLFASGCGDLVRPPDTGQPVAGVVTTALLTAAPTTWLFVGESTTLTTTLTPTQTFRRNGRPRGTSITWSSSNPTIGTITSLGVATGVSVGEVTMIATDGTVSESVILGVASAAPLAVTPAVVNDSIGSQHQLTTNTTLPSTWQSSDTAIATVSPSGLLTLRKTGAATIQVRTIKGTMAATAVSVLQGAASADSTITTPPPPPPPTGLLTSDLATLPQRLVTHAYPTSTRTIRVSGGQSLQRAIDTARFGDEIVLANGAVFSENVRLPAKGAGDGWIVIRGESQAVARGTRATPGLLSGVARVQTARNDVAAIEAAPGARGYWLTGFEVTAAPTVTSAYSLLMLDAQVTSTSLLPSRLVLDRMYVHGQDGLQLRRCVMLGADASMIIDSWLAQCHARGFDSQAVLIVTAQGPILVRNNRLEGAGENLMVGGDTPTIAGVFPADIEIIGNYFIKPLAWQSVGWTVKNLLEIKFGQRIDIRSNYFENNWINAQAGRAILIRAANQDAGAPWVRTNDVTFRHNVVTNSASGVQVAADDAYSPYPTNRVAILGNLVDRIGSVTLGGTGSVLLLHGKLKDVDVRANTMVFSPQSTPEGLGVQLDGTGAQGIRISSNVFDGGLYGLMLSGTTAGAPSLTAWAGTSYLFTGNAISAMANRQLPAGNLGLAEGQAVFGFMDFAARNYTPSSSSVLLSLTPVPGVPQKQLNDASLAR